MTIKQKEEEEEKLNVNVINCNILLDVHITHNPLHISNLPSFPFEMFALLIEVYILIYVSSNQTILSLFAKFHLYKIESFKENNEQKQVIH